VTLRVRPRYGRRFELASQEMLWAFFSIKSQKKRQPTCKISAERYSTGNLRIGKRFEFMAHERQCLPQVQSAPPSYKISLTITHSRQAFLFPYKLQGNFSYPDSALPSFPVLLTNFKCLSIQIDALLQKQFIYENYYL